MKIAIGIWALVVLAAVGGWVANVVKLIGMDFDHSHITGMMIGRAIGVVAAPLGAVLGYF